MFCMFKAGFNWLSDSDVIIAAGKLFLSLIVLGARMASSPFVGNLLKCLWSLKWILVEQHAKKMRRQAKFSGAKKFMSAMFDSPRDLVSRLYLWFTTNN